ncbi:beta-lactamase domain protein [Anaeromyxobacter sp. K]|uniref:MBL fold metallo-hydrolase n=1 Tax=Anaeromyxobacter sp. (strain K) TaxID=447217 RepID=UPI00015F8889|nr:MBL fold metallo-hydrolase [Anaeromyxobacter sp. K]ACG74274.1 beta-lactamase domain protein [Anaeromyxobacter sp. K]
MTLEPAREIAPGVHLIDTGYVRPRLAAAYLVRGRDAAAVVETGTAGSVPRVLDAVAAAGLRPDDVSHVVVTHVHLDHAAGAGALLRALPRARLVVHPRGARHMIDPSKLMAGASEVYGAERVRALYGEVVPAPAERVIEAPDGFTLDLGDRPLRALDAPGHAKHHLVLHDPRSRGFFTGDAFGISYRETDSAGGPFLFPTTTPVQLDPPALKATLARMLAEAPERVYLTHYGMLEGDIARHAAALGHGLDEHVRLARAAPPGPGRHAALREALAGQLLAGLAAHGAPLDPAAALELFGVDLDLNAQGLEVWLDAQAAA